MVFKSSYNYYARAVGIAINVRQNSFPDESVKKLVGKLCTGEEAVVLRRGATWTKFRYNGEIYYTYTNNLESKKSKKAGRQG